MTKVLLTAIQVAKIFQVSTAHVYVLAKRGKLPSVQFGRVVRFDEDEIDAFIQKHKTTCTFAEGKQKIECIEFMPDETPMEDLLWIISCAIEWQILREAARASVAGAEGGI